MQKIIAVWRELKSVSLGITWQTLWPVTLGKTPIHTVKPWKILIGLGKSLYASCPGHMVRVFHSWGSVSSTVIETS